MTPNIMSILLYLVIAVSVMFYTILDGFDLGTGMLHLFTRKDRDRRIFLNAIGPVWDGNEVWLVIVGGALFAAFPPVYASLFAGFYDFAMILLAGLIFRAVAIEFRSKHESPRWRHAWDVVFSLASFVIAIGIGVTFGNLVVGLPLDAAGNFVGRWSELLRPYQLLMGITVVSLLMMHGSIFLLMKTEGELHDQLRSWVTRCIVFFILMYLITTTATWLYQPHMVARLLETPILLIFGILPLIGFINVAREVKNQNDARAFLSSCFGIVFLFVLYGLGTFPYMVRASSGPEDYSLTVFNASSEPLTQKVLLIIVAIGVPLVLAYGTVIYRIFRGKVKIGPGSY